MGRPTRRRRDEDDEPRTSRYKDDDDEKVIDDDDDDRPRRSRGRGELPERGSRRGRDEDDDGDEDRPRRSRSRDEDDEDDDRGRGRSRRGRDEDDDDDRSSRRSRRSSKDDDDDDDKPRRGRGRDDDDEDNGRVSRSSNRGRDRGRSRDDDDDKPARRGGAKGRSGWESWRSTKKETYSDDDFKVDEDAPEVLIKIMDDTPFYTYKQHWVEGLRSTNRKSFLCIEDVGDDCPLDAAGAEVRGYAVFNVAVLSERGKPQIKVWHAGSGVADELERLSKLKTGPLTKEYYAVTKAKSGANKKGPVKYRIDVVKERDLADDWGIEPLDDAELDDLEKNLFDEDYFKYPAKSELREIAREWGRDAD